MTSNVPPTLQSANSRSSSSASNRAEHGDHLPQHSGLSQTVVPPLPPPLPSNTTKVQIPGTTLPSTSRTALACVSINPKVTKSAPQQVNKRLGSMNTAPKRCMGPTHSTSRIKTAKQTSQIERTQQAHKVALSLQKSKKRNTLLSGKRGSGFSRSEVDSLLELLAEHLPLARDEWEHVLRLHTERYPDYHRSVDSLKLKFATLHRVKTPTGDPTIPPEVKKAKSIRYLMTERADIGEGEDSDDAMGSFESDEDNEKVHVPLILQNERNDIGTGHEVVNESPNRPSSSTGARPLVRKRFSKDAVSSSTNELLELYKLQMMQDQARREDEKAMRLVEREEEKQWKQELREARSRREDEREEERKRLALERDEERARRQDESRRHESLLEVLILSLTKKQ